MLEKDYAINKLDAVLYFLSLKPFSDAANPGKYIHKEFNRKTQLNLEWDDFLRILKKLQKDGYIDLETGPHDENCYIINYDGLFFLSKKGLFRDLNHPYRYIQTTERIQRVKAIAKIIITILNAVAILYLMWKALPTIK